MENVPALTSPFTSTMPCNPSVPGPAPSNKDNILETGASATQSFAPISNICAHLNAFHVYASDTTRHVEANHYCTHISKDVRQCLIYDSHEKNARLIGVEYMISRELFEGLDEEEKRLWHSHDYEVHSGMLIMPNSMVLDAVWSVAERKEMEEVVGLYGKTFHMWQIDRGDELPLGMPELMMSYTKPEQVPWGKVKDRDQRYKVDSKKKAEEREYIPHWEPHQSVDGCWK